MKKLLVLFLLGGTLVCSVYGQTKRQDIITLLDLMGTRSQGAQMFDLMLPSLETLAPQAPAAFWSMLKSKMNTDSFSDLIIPIYDKHFSQDDIRGLIQFYESPLGRKMLEVTPQITEESFAAGQEWGQQLAQDILNELVKQGYYQ
ncbi:MAG: DUF2059 domain-containing protein [Treponema sp.]|jgi:hypothetical protein|nr:DUF2059 domain-containing protein [Treponema sp.]